MEQKNNKSAASVATISDEDIDKIDMALDESMAEFFQDMTPEKELQLYKIQSARILFAMFGKLMNAAHVEIRIKTMSLGVVFSLIESINEFFHGLSISIMDYDNSLVRIK